MKFISLIFFLAAMTGTWMMSHAKRPVPESVHAGIQNDLRRIIAELLQKNVPTAKDLVFDRFYTETVNPVRVVAHFSYGFDQTIDNGEVTRTQITGLAVLNKQGETADTSTWTVDDLKLSDSEVEFTEPLQVTASVAPGGATATPAPPDHE